MFLKLVLFIIIALNLTDNILGAWLHARAGNQALALQVIYVKYAVVGGVFVAFLFDLVNGFKLRSHEWCGLLYLAAVVVLGVGIIAAHSQYSAASRLYLYMFPVILYYAGVYFGARSAFDTQYLVKAELYSYLGMAALFCVLNVYFGAITIWRDYLDYAGFILDVKGFTDDVVEGLHGNFFFNYKGGQIVRFLGSFGDPLALAYAGMILIVPTYFVFPRQRLLFCGALIVIVAASFTRAVFLFLPIGALIYWLSPRRGFMICLAAAFFGIVAIIFAGDLISGLSDNSSTTAHVLSVNMVLDFINVPTLLGGALASNNMPGFEPGFFNMLFLFGFVPFALFLMFLRGIYANNSLEGSRTAYIAIIMLIAVLTLSIVSSVFFATTSAWFAWFLAGFVSRRSIIVLPDLRTVDENGRGAVPGNGDIER
ncbi:hypothetical protein [Sphingomonas sp. CV7422]|uniref:hypothetical protein n=1 Tax=Sphingomonas sp. CV7422 TaxID=3018036 RepID=UPI0022FEBAFC|nr:hypothetical protein [Sphingomonas sp. CV7422]